MTATANPLPVIWGNRCAARSCPIRRAWVPQGAPASSSRLSRDSKNEWLDKPMAFLSTAEFAKDVKGGKAEPRIALEGGKADCSDWRWEIGGNGAPITPASEDLKRPATVKPDTRSC